MTEIRALTLTQPWATLVALGVKRIETRSWRTHHRGPIYIHAAKALPKNWRSFADPAFVNELELYEDRVLTHEVAARLILAPAERTFGDYTAGRYAWLLKDVMPLLEPVPAAGALGLWRVGQDTLDRCTIDPSIRLDNAGAVV